MTEVPRAGSAVFPKLPDDPADDVLEQALRLRAIHVLSEAARLIDALPVPAEHRALLRRHLDEGREQVAAQPDLPAVQLPLLVHRALSGDEAAAVPIAAACTLLYLGADLFDAAADGELPEAWAGASASEVQLAATTLLAALPVVALSELEGVVPAARLWTIARDFARALTAMSAGQYDDLRLRSRGEVTLAHCRAIAERKAATEVALFARAGAVLATDDGATVEAYSRFGFCMGAAATFADDAADIWLGTPSQDLLNGTRSLPVVHALTALRGRARGELAELLGAATEDASAHDAVRDALTDAGSLRYTTLVVGVYRQRALRALEHAAPPAASGRYLRLYLDRVFVPRVADRKLRTAV